MPNQSKVEMNKQASLLQCISKQYFPHQHQGNYTKTPLTLQTVHYIKIPEGKKF